MKYTVAAVLEMSDPQKLPTCQNHQVYYISFTCFHSFCSCIFCRVQLSSSAKQTPGDPIFSFSPRTGDLLQVTGNSSRRRLWKPDLLLVE